MLICPNEPYTTTVLRHRDYAPRHHPKIERAIDYLVLAGWQTWWWVSIPPRSPAGRWQFPSSFSVEDCYFPVPTETKREFHDYICFRRNTFIKERFGKGMIIVWKLIKTSFLFKHFFNYSVDIFGVFGNVAELYSCYRGVESAPKHWLWAKGSTKVRGTTRSIRICNHYNRKYHKELKAHLFWKHYQLLF